jgi:CIC family chloride channel protein
MIKSALPRKLIVRARRGTLRPALFWILRHRHFVRSSEVATIAVAALIAVPVGLLVAVIHWAIALAHTWLFDLEAGVHLSAQLRANTVRAVGVPIIGGIVLAAARYIMRGRRPLDIVDPIEANALHSGRMSVRDSARLTLSALTSNVSGASVGMEAGYTQIGAALFSALAGYLRLRRDDYRIFVTAGAAAAISAAFNAPLAGAFYGFELVLGNYAPRALAPVAMASLVSAAVARPLTGQQALLFQVAGDLQVTGWIYVCSILLGVAAAMIGIMTMRATTLFEQILRNTAPDWLRPSFGGFILGIIAMGSAQVLGSGQGAIQFHLENHQPLAMLIALLLAKIFASAVCLGSGFRGGLFSSSLFLGCVLGGIFAALAALVAPLTGQQQTILQLVGLGALGAAIIGAPVCMVLLVLESTGNLPVTIAVLAGVVTASTIARVRFGYSFSTWRFHLRGLPLRGAFDVGWVKELKVAQAMRGDPRLVKMEMPIARLKAELAAVSDVARVFVIDDEGHFRGLIETRLLRDPDVAVAEATLVAADLVVGRDNVLLAGEDIRTALDRFAALKAEVLPVVTPGGTVVGYLSETAALKFYTDALERRRGEDLGAPAPR